MNRKDRTAEQSRRQGTRREERGAETRQGRGGEDEEANEEWGRERSRERT